MWRYVIRRILWLIVIALCVAVLIFTILYFVPGDPAKIALGEYATAEDLDAFRERYGLNDTFMVQLVRYLYQTFLQFDFGTSFNSKSPVIDELVVRVPRTLMLGGSCIVIGAVVGIPLGIICALRRNTIADQGIMVVSMLGISIPDFWMALLMILLFSLNLGWLPARGIGGIRYWIMPVIAGTFGGLASILRQTRSAVLETIRADFVTTARAKGAPERTVIIKHMLPNAMIPIVSTLGARFGMAIVGSIVIESVFSFPGLGAYLVTAINNRDQPVIRTCVLLFALFASVVNLIVDIIYAYLDPRIKAQYETYSKKRKKGGEAA